MKKIALFALVLCTLGASQALAAGPTAHSSAEKAVEIDDFAFQPATLTVARGTTVRFTNKDDIAHTATRNGGGFNTKRIGPGKSASVRFNSAGTFRYHCSIHPSMKGKIVVR